MEFIGIDVGSQGTRVVLIDRRGRTVAEDSVSYPIEYPRKYWAEQDPLCWESAALQGLAAVCSRSKNPAEIRSIGIAAQVDGVVAIDKSGQPLGKAIIWMDKRAVEEERHISEVIGVEEIFAITGCNLDASHVLPKVLWLRGNTEILDSSFKLLLPASYLVFCLTGELAVDYSNASSTLMYRVKEKVWDDGILKEFAISRGLLPDILPSTHIAGRLRKQTALRLGLPNPPVVAVGCGDEHAAFVGTGVIHDGIAFDMAGTGEVVGASCRLPLLDRTRLVETHGHPLSELWLLENPGFVSGGNLRWFRDNLCAIGSGACSYESLVKEAEGVPAGSEGLIFLPTLMGAKAPEWNSAAVGNIYGLSLHSTRAHITRAILEGSAYGIRDVLGALSGMGLRFSRVRVTGGGSRSRLWNQIKADVLDLPVETLATPQSTALGAALIGAVSCGAFSTLQEAVKTAVKTGQVFEPGDQRAKYEEAYPRYRDLYFALKPVFGGCK
ncbi:MAG: hypothetical protein A2Y63_06595 [Candidatus Riflebacteria bacterium RBG_13_59_9]|nr:MAG: hypothetical protein A2Y63_06595 [Candidatus Riflebacteria bacterium RBG_13_59_9]